MSLAITNIKMLCSEMSFPQKQYTEVYRQLMFTSNNPISIQHYIFITQKLEQVEKAVTEASL